MMNIKVASWIMLVNMKSKVPVQVLNVRDERVLLVKGMHLGKVTEATDEIHVF